MAGNKRKRKKWKQLFTYNFLWPFWFNFINPYILILKRISDFKRNFQNCTLYTWAVKTHLQEVWRDLEIFSLLLLIHAWFPLKAVHFIILAKPTTFFSSEARTTMLQRLIREQVSPVTFTAFTTLLHARWVISFLWLETNENEKSGNNFLPTISYDRFDSILLIHIFWF